MSKHSLKKKKEDSSTEVKEEIIEENNNEMIDEIAEEVVQRDYSKMDLVDLIDQPAWKTI